MFTQIDHLIYGAATLAIGMDAIEEKLGVRPVYSGQHKGLGTHNALLSLGNNTYFEVIAPDPSQKMEGQPLWIDIDLNQPPRLIRWVAQSKDLEQCSQIAKANNIPFGAIAPGSRTTPDGQLISWTASNPFVESFGGLMPFFIDWGTSKHPSTSLPLLGALKQMKGIHPDAEKMRKYWNLLGIDLDIEQGDQPQLIAWIETKNGIVELH